MKKFALVLGMGIAGAVAFSSQLYANENPKIEFKDLPNKENGKLVRVVRVEGLLRMYYNFKNKRAYDSMFVHVIREEDIGKRADMLDLSSYDKPILFWMDGGKDGNGNENGRIENDEVYDVIYPKSDYCPVELNQKYSA